MIIRMSVSNMLSMRDEGELSFVAAAADHSLPNQLLNAQAIDPARLLRSVVIYGANASGKSNVLANLIAIRNMVDRSHRELGPEDDIPVTPFYLDRAFEDQPSRCEIDFIKDGVRSNFGFVIDRKHVLEEWLYVYPLNRRQRMYHRVSSEYQFGAGLKGENRTISRLTRPNSLFISAAAQNNHDYLQSYSSWIIRNLRRHTGNVTLHEGLKKRLSQDSGFRERVLNLLKEADTGICDLSVEDEPFPEELAEEMKKTFTSEMLESFRRDALSVVRFKHRSDQGTCERKFDIDVESRGTQKLIALSGLIFDTLDNGGLLMVDELDASLHPMITRAVIELFAGDANKTNAQLLFTTHDSSLLDPTLFRRDQIWFTEKDGCGATHLYPLSDYKPRKGENLSRGYMQGRYGAVPLAGALA